MCILRKIYNKLSVLSYRLFCKGQFKHFGSGVNIVFPRRIEGRQRIILDNNVHIYNGSWLAAFPLTGFDDCILEVGEGSVIGHFNHIYATKKIKIGRKVLLADKIYISDNLHGYEDINVPIMDQPIKQIKTVEIGDGSWIGENAVILGAKLGKHVVVAANAVVTKDVPDYTVVAGIPAKPIKRFVYQTGRWEKVDE